MDNKRAVALILLFFGLFSTILISFGLAEEVFRTDIPDIQKELNIWIALVAMCIVPFIAGLHFLVPHTSRCHHN